MHDPSWHDFGENEVAGLSPLRRTRYHEQSYETGSVPASLFHLKGAFDESPDAAGMGGTIPCADALFAESGGRHPCRSPYSQGQASRDIQDGQIASRYPSTLRDAAQGTGVGGSQREAFITKVRERQQAINAWKKDNEPQQKLLQQKATDAKANGDVVAENKAKAELKALHEELTKLEEEHHAQLTSTLTPEQCGKWAAYNAYTGLMRSYAKITLSPEQKAQIKDIAYQHAREFGELPEGDKKAREALRKQIMQEIHDQVLTAEQKVSMEPKPKVDQAKH